MLWQLVLYLRCRDSEPICSSKPLLTIVSIVGHYIYIANEATALLFQTINCLPYTLTLFSGLILWVCAVEAQIISVIASIKLQRAKAAVFENQMSAVEGRALCKERQSAWLLAHEHWLNQRRMSIAFVAYAMPWIAVMLVVHLATPRIENARCFGGARILSTMGISLFHVVIMVGLMISLTGLRENLGLRRRIHVNLLCIGCNLVMHGAVAMSPAYAAFNRLYALNNILEGVVFSYYLYEMIIRPRLHLRETVLGDSASQFAQSTSSEAWTLEKVLAEPAASKALQRFLMREFAVENILFWNACETYRHLFVSTVENRDKRIHLLIDIYETYIKENGKLEVNLSTAVRTEAKGNIGVIDGKMNLEKAADAPKDALIRAQRSIFALIKANFWQRFQESSLFKDIATRHSV